MSPGIRSYSASVSVLLLVTEQLRFAVSDGWRAWAVAGLRAVPDEPGLPSAEDLAVLPHDVLAERLAEACRVIAQMTVQVRETAVRVEETITENGRLAARV
jgi:hypothetical protein